MGRRGRSRDREGRAELTGGAEGFRGVAVDGGGEGGSAVSFSVSGDGYRRKTGACLAFVASFAV